MQMVPLHYSSAVWFNNCHFVAPFVEKLQHKAGEGLILQFSIQCTENAQLIENLTLSMKDYT